MVNWNDIPMTDTCSATTGGYVTGYYRAKIEEEPEDFYEQEELELIKKEQMFAVMNFNNALPSKAFVKHVQIKPKRFKQKKR